MKRGWLCAFLLLCCYLHEHAVMASWSTRGSGYDLWNVGFDEASRRVGYSPICPPEALDPKDHWGRVVNEFTGGWRFIQANARIVPTLSRGPRPYNLVCGDGHFRGTLLSELGMWNSWPEVQNQSVFPFFLEDSPFGQFVRGYYQSSCAVVYYPSDGDPKIIGTGAYVDSIWGGTKEGVVATARHNFSGIPLSRLYVRFFHYDVARVDGCPHWLRVNEDFLDVPVTNAEIAAGGLDAGILRLLPFSRHHQRRYAQMVHPCVEGYGDDWATIPEGKYAMFHFAGAEAHISVGHIYPSPGAVLSSNIRIEAGPGASGAPVFQQIGNRVTTHGISIYRHMDDWGIGRDTQRTIIPFVRFTRPGILDDPLVAPYRINPFFQVFSPRSLEEDGYEFLYWRIALHAGRRVGKPGGDRYDPIYRVDANHSVHHIIPCFDLLFLWDYLDEDGDLSHNLARGRYAHFRPLIEQLCPLYFDQYRKPGITREGRLRHQLDRTYFAWSWWNLFKGWNEDHRTDDPKLGDAKGDRSEKQKPQSFDEPTWNAVKELYSNIQALKSPPYRNTEKEHNLLESLSGLGKAWRSRHVFERISRDGVARLAFPIVHPYLEDEWIRQGYRYDHPVYGIKF